MCSCLAVLRMGALGAAAALAYIGGELDLMRGLVTAAAEFFVVSEACWGASLLASVTCVHVCHCNGYSCNVAFCAVHASNADCRLSNMLAGDILALSQC